MDVLWLSKAEVERLLEPRALLDALAQGFADLTAGKVACPSRPELAVPHAGFLLPMSAWQAGKPMTVKMVTVFDGNTAKGMPSHLALICLFDPETGATVAVMDGEYITAMRTAASAAVSVSLLAGDGARRLAIRNPQQPTRAEWKDRHVSVRAAGAEQSRTGARSRYLSFRIR